MSNNSLQGLGPFSSADQRVGMDSVSPHSAPAGEDVRAFQKFMERGQRRQPMGESGAGPYDSAKTKADSPDKLFSMDKKTGALQNASQESGAELIASLFRGLESASGLQGAWQAAGAAGAAQPASDFDQERLESLVSRILVNTPERGGAQIRLQINDNVLRGTEISIQRDSAGSLSIRIVSTDPASFQTLVAARPNLVQALEAHERGPVSVEMNAETDQGENDARQRSKGLDAFDAENV